MTYISAIVITSARNASPKPTAERRVPPTAREADPAGSEATNQEKIRGFPDVDPLMRLVASLHVEIDEK